MYQARSGTMNLGGSLTRQVEQDCSVSEASPHIANIGRLVEDMENKIRNTLNEIYFGKTRDIVNGLRSVVPLKDANTAKDLQVRDTFLRHINKSYFSIFAERVAPDDYTKECWSKLNCLEVNCDRRLIS